MLRKKYIGGDFSRYSAAIVEWSICGAAKLEWCAAIPEWSGLICCNTGTVCCNTGMVCLPFAAIPEWSAAILERLAAILEWFYYKSHLYLSPALSRCNTGMVNYIAIICCKAGMVCCNTGTVLTWTTPLFFTAATLEWPFCSNDRLQYWNGFNINRSCISCCCNTGMVYATCRKGS